MLQNRGAQNAAGPKPGGGVGFEGGKKSLGNLALASPGAVLDFFWPPEGSEVDFWSLLGPTLRPRGPRTPQNTLRGAILEYLLMCFDVFFVLRVGSLFVVV